MARHIRPQHQLTVTRQEWLSRSLVRLWLSGAPADVFGDRPHTDAYFKIFVPGTAPLPAPPIDIQELRATLPPEAAPARRTYTLRGYDAERGELAIEFVSHGDHGRAGPWAAGVQPGDQLVVSEPGGGYAPDPAAEWHLFAGDESALPAIASALEALAPEARGHALIEVNGPEDEVPLKVPDGVELRWLHRAGAEAGTTTLLPEALAALPWPGGDVQVFAHGERGAMKAIRDVLAPREIPRERLSLSAYWAHGRAEDQFQAEKRQPIGKIL